MLHLPCQETPPDHTFPATRATPMKASPVPIHRFPNIPSDAISPCAIVEMGSPHVVVRVPSSTEALSFLLSRVQG